MCSCCLGSSLFSSYCAEPKVGPFPSETHGLEFWEMFWNYCVPFILNIQYFWNSYCINVGFSSLAHCCFLLWLVLVFILSRSFITVITFLLPKTSFFVSWDFFIRIVFLFHRSIIFLSLSKAVDTTFLLVFFSMHGPFLWASVFHTLEDFLMCLRIPGHHLAHT